MAKTITGLALIKNDIQYVNSATSAGSIQQIPTPDSGVEVIDVWATPVNYGVYSGWVLKAYNPTNPIESVKPTPFSIACSKVSSTISSDWSVVLGTSTAYITAANGGAALPTTWPDVIHTKAELSVCQTINTTNDAGQYVATIGVPTLAANEKYFIFGFLNGVALATAFATGFGNLTDLLSFLNSTNWNTVGTWTKTADNLTLIATQASGSGTDVFCGNLIAINISA